MKDEDYGYFWMGWRSLLLDFCCLLARLAAASFGHTPQLRQSSSLALLTTRIIAWAWRTATGFVICACAYCTCVVFFFAVCVRVVWVVAFVVERIARAFMQAAALERDVPVAVELLSEEVGGTRGWLLLHMASG
jgi:hypothetical protein